MDRALSLNAIKHEKKTVLKKGSLADVWASIHKNRQEEVVFEARCKGPAMDGQRRTAVPGSGSEGASPRHFLSLGGDASWKASPRRAQLHASSLS